MADYSVAKRGDAVDWMADYPGFGEMRWYADALGTEQVSFSWRTMPPGTGGRGSYGHRHPGQEEVYFVIAGRVTFKIDDDVFEAGPQTAVRIGGDARSTTTRGKAPSCSCSRPATPMPGPSAATTSGPRAEPQDRAT